MTDCLRLLPPFQWRGVRYPVLARSVSFTHDGVRHTIQYQDGEYIEQLGARDFTFSYTIPMREDIARGPYKNLFSLMLVPLMKACRDRSPGELIDPIYGTFRCVPTKYTDDSDVQKRDGTDVQVEFLHSPELSVDPQFTDSILGVSGLVADAGQLDVAVQAVDWQQEPSPEGMTDILSAINGIGRQALGFMDRMSATVDDLIFRLEKIETTAKKVATPESWNAARTARRLRDNAIRIKDNFVAANRKTRAFVLRHRSTISAISTDSGTPLKDLLSLNPWLATSPTWPTDTAVKVLA